MVANEVQNQISNSFYNVLYLFCFCAQLVGEKNLKRNCCSSSETMEMRRYKTRLVTAFVICCGYVFLHNALKRKQC